MPSLAKVSSTICFPWKDKSLPEIWAGEFAQHISPEELARAQVIVVDFTISDGLNPIIENFKKFLRELSIGERKIAS